MCTATWTGNSELPAEWGRYSWWIDDCRVMFKLAADCIHSLLQSSPLNSQQMFLYFWPVTWTEPFASIYLRIKCKSSWDQRYCGLVYLNSEKILVATKCIEEKFSSLLFMFYIWPALELIRFLSCTCSSSVYRLGNRRSRTGSQIPATKM